VEGVVGGFEQPAEVGTAVTAEVDTPGVAGEPAKFGGGFPDGAAAGGFVETADAEDDAGGVGEAVFEAAVPPGAVVRVGNVVFALGTEDRPVGVIDGVLEGVGDLLEVAVGSGGVVRGVIVPAEGDRIGMWEVVHGYWERFWLPGLLVPRFGWPDWMGEPPTFQLVYLSAGSGPAKTWRATSFWLSFLYVVLAPGGM